MKVFHQSHIKEGMKEMRFKTVGSVLMATMLVFSASSAMAADSNAGKPTKEKYFQTNSAVLKNNGITDEVIAQLGDEMYPLAKEITTKHLSKEQIKNYVDGIYKAKEQARKVKENREKGIVDESVQVTREVKDGMVTLKDGKTIPVPQRNKGTEGEVSTMALGHGPYYNVDARVGYNQVTHLVDLPSVRSTTSFDGIPIIWGS
jgi:hypothetical protein